VERYWGKIAGSNVGKMVQSGTYKWSTQEFSDDLGKIVGQQCRKIITRFSKQKYIFLKWFFEKSWVDDLYILD